ERFRHARFHGRFALDDGLVNLGAAIYVIRLCGEQFLQDERRAVRFEGPDFHFSEALAAELSLAAQWLLGDQRVRSDRPGVDLVVHQVRKFQHVDVADGDGLFEFVAGHAVVQVGFARFRQARLLEQRLDLAFARSVEHRRSHVHALGQRRRHRHQLLIAEVGNGVGQSRVLEQRFQFAPDRFFLGVLGQHLRDLLAQFVAGPSQVGLENLSHVHTGRNAQRVEHDFHRRTVFEVRHVLVGQDAGNHAFVAVTAGHLVAHTQLALHGDVHLHQLDHARWQFVALGQLVFLLVDDFLQHVDLARGHFLDLVDLLIYSRVLVGVFDTLQVAGGNALDRVAIKNRVLGQQALVGALVVQIGLHFLAAQNVLQTLQALVGQNPYLVRKVLFQLRDLRAFDELGALILLLAFAGEDLDIHDNAFNARRTVKRNVAHVAGLFAENRAQQFFFRRKLGLALGRDFAHQNVALLDRRPDANDARFVQIAQHRLRDVGNVARNFFRTQLGVARLDLILLDVHRGVVILFHQLF